MDLKHLNIRLAYKMICLTENQVKDLWLDKSNKKKPTSMSLLSISQTNIFVNYSHYVCVVWMKRMIGVSISQEHLVHNTFTRKNNIKNSIIDLSFLMHTKNSLHSITSTDNKFIQNKRNNMLIKWLNSSS